MHIPQNECCVHDKKTLEVKGLKAATTAQTSKSPQLVPSVKTLIHPLFEACPTFPGT